MLFQNAAEVILLRRPARTRVQIVQIVREVVRVLREAGTPLPRREVAAWLGIQPWAATYRLMSAACFSLAPPLL